MLKIYSHDDRFMVWQVKQLLEHKGIACFIKNEYAIGGVGELSPFDCMPEVWISDDDWFNKASEFIAQLLAKPKLSEPWICASCNEQNEPAFELCWQCGQDREG
jgi:hypothetical protein